MSEHPPELVEKVARAMAAPSAWVPLHPAAKSELQRLARAALDAITETHAVVELPQQRETVRLLHAAANWIAGAIREDPSGEPWTLTRTLLNELVSQVDALGGWPPSDGTEAPD